MNVDVEALLAESVAGVGHQCHTCKWLDSRPGEERAKWDAALEQPKTWPATQVARAMAKVAPDDTTSPTAGSILNHRSGHVRQRGHK